MPRAESRITRAFRALVAGLILLAPGAALAAGSVDGEARRELGVVGGELERRRDNVREIDDRARRLERELETIRFRLLGLMPRIDAAQAEIEKSEERLAELSVATSQKQRALEGRREEISITLASLSRLSRRSAISILASSGSPIDTYRGARLMSMLVERLEGEASEIRADLGELASLRGEVEAESRRRAEGNRQLQVRRVELEELVSARRALQSRLMASRRREEKEVARLSREAKSLTDLVNRLSAAETRRRRDAARRAALERRAAIQRKAIAAATAERTRARRREGSDMREQRRLDARTAERRARERVAAVHTQKRFLLERETTAAKQRVELEAARLADEAARLERETAAAKRRVELDEAARLERETAAAKRRVELETARLADEAAQLEAVEREKMLRVAALPRPVISFSQSRGKLPLPARGRIIGRFGSAVEAAGLSLKGIRMTTAAGTQVVAPFDGKVVFAGEFRDYGLLLIISLGEEYHLLLSGMSRVYGIVGQHVLAGEPVGEMGSIDEASPTLYVELRREGKPINPLPWMAVAKGKVSG